MTLFPTDHGLLANLAATGAALAAGLLIGAFHHAALWWSVRRLAAAGPGNSGARRGFLSSPGRGRIRTSHVQTGGAPGIAFEGRATLPYAAAFAAAAMALLRFAVVAIAFVALAHLGTVPLLAALAGMLASRRMAVRQVAALS